MKDNWTDLTGVIEKSQGGALFLKLIVDCNVVTRPISDELQT